MFKPKQVISLDDIFSQIPVSLNIPLDAHIIRVHVGCLISASLLLDSLLSYLTSGDHFNCKAVYLHVLTTNQTAIRFYERRNFQMHSFLPYYYSIKGTPRDGYSYVLYINGGQPPWTIIYPCSSILLLINLLQVYIKY